MGCILKAQMFEMCTKKIYKNVNNFIATIATTKTTTETTAIPYTVYVYPMLQMMKIYTET